jgi:hypothetical protein
MRRQKQLEQLLRNSSSSQRMLLLLQQRLHPLLEVQTVQAVHLRYNLQRNLYCLLLLL